MRRLISSIIVALLMVENTKADDISHNTFIVFPETNNEQTTEIKVKDFLTQPDAFEKNKNL